MLFRFPSGIIYLSMNDILPLVFMLVFIYYSVLFFCSNLLAWISRIINVNIPGFVRIVPGSNTEGVDACQNRPLYVLTIPDRYDNLYLHSDSIMKCEISSKFCTHVRKTSFWSVEHILTYNTPNCDRIFNSIKITLVGQGPGLHADGLCFSIWFSSCGKEENPRFLICTQKWWPTQCRIKAGIYQMDFLFAGISLFYSQWSAICL